VCIVQFPPGLWALPIHGAARQLAGPIHFEVFDMLVWFAIAATEASALGLVLCGDTGGWFTTASAVMARGAGAAASRFLLILLSLAAAITLVEFPFFMFAGGMACEIKCRPDTDSCDAHCNEATAGDGLRSRVGS
jgi:hypothetical protein